MGFNKNKWKLVIATMFLLTTIVLLFTEIVKLGQAFTMMRYSDYVNDPGNKSPIIFVMVTVLPFILFIIVNVANIFFLSVESYVKIKWRTIIKWSLYLASLVIVFIYIDKQVVFIKENKDYFFNSFFGPIIGFVYLLIIFYIVSPLATSIINIASALLDINIRRLPYSARFLIIPVISLVFDIIILTIFNADVDVFINGLLWFIIIQYFLAFATIYSNVFQLGAESKEESEEDEG